MILNLLSPLLNNPYFLGALASLLGAVALWFKGYQAGKKTIEANDALAQMQEAKEIQQAEAKNQDLASKAQNTNETIKNTTAIPDLIKLWNGDQKTPSNLPSKDK